MKDLRTWNATALATTALATTALATTVLDGSRPTRRVVSRMYGEVSDHLGNTPAVARKSYVDPRLVDRFERGETIAPALADRGSDDLSRDRIREPVERAVYELLADG